MWKEMLMGRPVKKFENGKWYRFIGKTRPTFWNHDGYMDAMLDGVPRKFIQKHLNDNPFFGQFEGIHETWIWDHPKIHHLWRETAPPSNGVMTGT